MSAAPDVTRRALLFGRRAVAPALRPPWARDEAAFLDTCTGCNACTERCPEHAIAFPLTARVPVPIVDAERCSGCGACVGVCPVDAITLAAHIEEPA